VVIPLQSRENAIYVGMDVQEGPGKVTYFVHERRLLTLTTVHQYYLSKVVTFAPRFVIQNKTAEDLYCRQLGTASALLVKMKDVIHVYAKRRS
jgi:SHR-binding domain of vacuolar-sorting associated protein 13